MGSAQQDFGIQLGPAFREDAGQFCWFRADYQGRYCRFLHTPGLYAFITTDITVETRKPYPLVLDGDLIGHTPVRLRMLQNTLKVFVSR